MKRICFVVTLSGTYRAFLYDLSNFLIERHNYDVTVVCDEDASMYDLETDRLHYHPVKMKRGMSSDGLSAIFRLYKFFRKEKFEIVQYSTRNAGTYASIAAWMAGIKCRLYCQWGMMFVALKGWKKLLLKWDEKLITSLSTVIESESFSMFNEALKRGIYKRDKASVIWNGSACGVNLSKYSLSFKSLWRNEIRARYSIGDDACVFGYCGRITRDKGINELFAGFRRVLKERLAYLMVIGSYDNVNSIDPELLAWAQSCPQVIFTGRTDNVPMYYSALDMFVSLSYREGFGLVVIEAAAMQVPGIVSDALGQRDTIENMVTGLSVPTKNVDKVVDAMRFCIDNPGKVEEMGRSARTVVEEKYNQETLFEKLALHRNQLIGEE